MVRDKERKQEFSHSPRQREMNGRTKQNEQQILEIVEIISREFTEGGTSNNVRKIHLRVMMNVESKK